MNSVSSETGANRPILQSSFACSIRSFELETKFHQMCRAPSIRSPPRSIIRAWEDSCARSARNDYSLKRSAHAAPLLFVDISAGLLQS